MLRQGAAVEVDARLLQAPVLPVEGQVELELVLHDEFSASVLGLARGHPIASFGAEEAPRMVAWERDELPQVRAGGGRRGGGGGALRGGAAVDADMF